MLASRGTKRIELRYFISAMEEQECPHLIRRQQPGVRKSWTFKSTQGSSRPGPVRSVGPVSTSANPEDFPWLAS